MLACRLSLIVAGILLSVAIQAGVYRWVDENGVTVYSQVPPPADVQKERIDPTPPSPVSEKEAWKEVNQEWRKMQDRQDITKEQAIADSDQSKKKHDEEKNCSIAQRTLQQLGSSRRNRVRTPEGGVKRMPAKEREDRLREAREMEEKYCN